MDVIANAMITIGFFYVGSGVSPFVYVPFFRLPLGLLAHYTNKE
jgi:hypothetical protein